MKKKIVFDVILNMAASFIPIFLLQFIILPQVALNINADLYGQLLSIMAFVYLSASSFGSVLNNSKLIHYKKYNELKIEGDFNIILLVFLFSNIIITIMGLIYYGESMDHLSSISLILISTIFLFNTYASVEFRIQLKYLDIFVNSILLFLGYLIGFGLFLYTGNWSLIYLIGFGLNLIYIIMRTNIIHEKLVKTSLFKVTAKEIILLLGSGILVSLGAYADKLIIFPLLGGSAVAIYFVATLLGKTISLAINPVTSVLLSYLAHMNKFNGNQFRLLYITAFVVGFICYWCIILVSQPVLTLIYPQYVEAAMQYVPITTASIIVILIISIINPVLLIFSSAKWQVVINSFYMLVYFTLSISLLIYYGLMGLCIGILIANIIKLIVTIALYSYNNKKLINADV
jgi:O-antigen/teichoic acid export membrane protein